MSHPALYDVLPLFQHIHETVLKLGESLSEEQLHWKPAGYSTSIGFHLWHLGRESDYLRATILERFPQLGPDFGLAKQIWDIENLREKWGFPAELGETGVGTGISDEAAANLPLPPKAELLDYVRRVYAALQQFVELLDSRYPQLENVAEDVRGKVERVRFNLLAFLLHDARHLGMMECLKGLQTGFGSATEQR